MQIRCMRPARVKGDDNAFRRRIDLYLLDATDSHEWFAQFANAFVAIFALRRDLNCFQYRMIGALRIVRVSWIHYLIYARRSGDGRLS